MLVEITIFIVRRNAVSTNVTKWPIQRDELDVQMFEIHIHVNEQKTNQLANRRIINGMQMPNDKLEIFVVCEIESQS